MGSGIDPVCEHVKCIQFEYKIVFDLNCRVQRIVMKKRELFFCLQSISAEIDMGIHPMEIITPGCGHLHFPSGHETTLTVSPTKNELPRVFP